MSTVRRLLILLLLANTVNSQDFRPWFSTIANYMAHNNVKLCYFVTCWPNKEQVSLAKFLQGRNIRTAFLNQLNTTENMCNDKLLNSGNVFQNTLEYSKKNALGDSIYARFNGASKWLLLVRRSQNNENKYLENYFMKTKSRNNADIELVLRDKSNKERYRTEEISYTETKGILTTSGKEYSPNSGEARYLRKASYYSEKRNMSNVTLRAASVVDKKYYTGNFEEYITDRRNRHRDTLSKIHYSVFRLLQDIHNFSYTLRLLKSSRATALDVDNRIYELLKENKTDISIAGGLQTLSGTSLADYLTTTYRLRTCFFFRNPLKHDLLTNMFLKPFSSRLWWATVATALSFMLMLKFSFWMCNCLNEESYWCTVVFEVVAIFVQQGLSMVPNHRTSRLVYLNLLVVNYLLYNYYTSIWVAMLLSFKPQEYYKIEDLTNSGLKVAVENESYITGWFPAINSSDIKRFYETKRNKFGILTVLAPEHGMEMLQQGQFAYYTDFSKAYAVTGKIFKQDALCDLTELRVIPPKPASFVVQKKSQYFELFQISLRRLHQNGLIHRVHKTWNLPKPECYSKTSSLTVGMDEVYEAFLYWTYGIAASLSLLVVEILRSQNVARNRV